MMNQHCISHRTTLFLLLLVLISMLCGLRPAQALGPNLMVNSGFEGGDYAFSNADIAPFRTTKDKASAHSGLWALQAVIQPTGSCTLQNPLQIWPNTGYTTSVWYRGSGTLQLQVLSGDLSASMAQVNFSAASSWKKASVSYTTGDIHSLQIKINEVGGPGTTVYLDDFSTSLTDADTITFDPNHPSTHGFQRLFDDEFTDSHTIDVKNTQGDGYLWYLNQFYGLPDTTPNMFSVAGGVLTITDCPVQFSDTLHTATPAKNAEGFIGTVFRDTAPLYFETRFRVRNFDKTGTTKGDPGFWTQDLQMGVRKDTAMLGHPDHTEFIENDVIEMNHTWGGRAGEHISGFGDWTDSGSLGDVTTQYVPDGTDYGQYHVYGCLLVPATSANGWHGYRTIYFDGVPMESACWIGNQTYQGVFPETKKSMGSYLWSQIDNRWEDLIIGNGQGGVSPMDVDYVRVYGVSRTSMKTVHPASSPSTSSTKATL